MINHIVFLTQWFQMYGIWWIYFWRLVQLIRCYLARLTFYRDKKREKMGISESPLLSSSVVLKSCVSGGGISTRWIALDPFPLTFLPPMIPFYSSTQRITNLTWTRMITVAVFPLKAETTTETTQQRRKQQPQRQKPTMTVKQQQQKDTYW